MCLPGRHPFSTHLFGLHVVAPRDLLALEGDIEGEARPEDALQDQLREDARLLSTLSLSMFGRTEKRGKMRIGCSALVPYLMIQSLTHRDHFHVVGEALLHQLRAARRLRPALGGGCQLGLCVKMNERTRLVTDTMPCVSDVVPLA